MNSAAALTLTPPSMPVTSANVRNLNESRAQALQALQSVSERLGDLLGVTDLSGNGTRRDESGDLVNEEGLPIIDITEPVDELDTPSLSAATEDDGVIEEDNYPEPISKLSTEALAASRKHRDKLLDLLEQEEEREGRRSRHERQLEMERKREAARIEMEERILSQGLELEKRRQAKELEKKMAKALISGLDEPQTVQPKAPVTQSDGKTKKVVTFADSPSAGPETPPNAPQQDEINWGDVVPVMLPAWKSRVSSSQTHPMKMEVVERASSLPSINALPTLQQLLDDKELAKDSDDESDLEVASDTTVIESEDEDVVLSAQRHRELALEYHRRREALASGAGTLKLEDDELLDDHDHDTPNWDQAEVPLDATLAHPHPKPRISKFKASFFGRKISRTPAPVTQIAGIPSSPRESTDPSQSATFGTSVLPPDALSKSIRLGKLVDGQLVAGPHDEEDIDREEREEEEIRKLLGTFSSLSVRGSPAIISSSSSQPSARQAVIVDNVRDSSAHRDSPVKSALDVKPRRVSRFIADRSGY